MKAHLALLALAASSFAVAADLKPAQEEALARFNKDVQTNLDAANAACGTSMLLGVKMACSSPAYKKAVAKNVKGLACLFAGVKKDIPSGRESTREKANLSLEKGIFIYRLDPAHAGVAIAADQVLRAALDK